MENPGLGDVAEVGGAAADVAGVRTEVAIFLESPAVIRESLRSSRVLLGLPYRSEAAELSGFRLMRTSMQAAAGSDPSRSTGACATSTHIEHHPVSTVTPHLSIVEGISLDLQLSGRQVPP